MNQSNLYAETVPVFIKFLGNLRGLIVKAQAHLKTSGSNLAEKDLLEAKLAPDMYNFTKQIGYVYFMALETVINLSGKEMPKFTYDEKSFTELTESLIKVEDFLKSFKIDDIKSEDLEIKTFLDEAETYSPEKYVRELALPNFFFHVTTAYDILRHQGVPLGKDDYLGLV